jgi:hypothetical protein
MDHKKYFVFISTASLLHFRGIEHWLIEVATRLNGSMILTFSTGLKSVDNVKARVALAKSRLGNVEWHEIRAISHEHAGKGVPSFITRFMKHSGIAIPINLKIIKLLEVNLPT